MAATIERKVVSVLFSDLVGFTSLSEEMDPEDIAAVQDAYFAVARETLERHGGRLEKFIGDAAVAFFGAPLARDGDAARAVAAGLALASAVDQLGARLGLAPDALSVRVGVNTGEVAVHPEAGPGDALLTGDPVNVASRLQAAAPTGGVLVGETTALAVADAIELEPLGPTALKGKREPVRVWRAVSVRPEPSRDAAMGNLRAPIVGRDVELARLEAALGRQSGRVVIVAPPGVGKTRLVTELGARVESRAVVRFSARLRPEVVGLFQPTAHLLLDALRHAGVRVGSEGARPEARDLLLRLLQGPSSGPAAAARSADAVLDTVWPVEGNPGPALPSDVLFSAWIDALDELAGGRESIWIIEDVHWAGPDFLAFLSEAGRRIARSGRLLVCTARPSVLEVAAAWCHEPGVDLLDLDPLSPPDAAALIGALVGDAMPAELAQRIVKASDGNPLFIEELLRTWISIGTLVRSDGTWRLAGEPGRVALPATVRAIYSAQLDDLPAAARLVARRASVAGPRFPVGTVETLDAPDAESGVDVLLRRALLSGPHHMGAFGEIYAFRHALLQEAAYASLARTERSRFHVRIARWFEGIPTAERAEIAETIGAHYAAAVEQAPALAAEVDDGLDKRTAARLGAEWLTKATEVAASIRSGHDLLARARDLLGDASPEVEARIELAEARLAFLEGDGPRSLEHAQKGLRIAEEAGANQLVVNALISITWLEVANDTERALALIDRALQIPEADRYVPTYEAPRSLRGIVLMYRGELDVARDELLGQLATGRSLGDESADGLLLHLSELEYRAGRFEAGLHHAEQALRICEDREEMQGVGCMSYVRALHRAALGDTDGARADATRGLEIATELGDAIFAAQNGWVLGFLALSRCDPAEAAIHLEPLPAVAAAIGATDPNGWLLCDPDLIEALAAQGRLDEAEELATLLEERGERAGLPRGLSVSRRCRALVEGARGNLDQALEAAGAATQVQRIEVQPFELARAIAVKGSIERVAGREVDARESLRRAAEAFDHLRARLWADRARSELRMLAAT